MTVSVIIVNYNVKFFLEQCLRSVLRAAGRTTVQIIVVDNASTDGSLKYLQTRFPQVRFVANEENTGFGKACNKGLEYATGEAVLFLNPDTLLAEDTLDICTHFLEQHPDAGALGVRMLDGAGKFLKESKRAFPSPQTSLFKLAGLARLFPHSKTFSRYHLGHLDAHQNHEVDVLAGAFMLVRTNVLEKVGAFDEAFFMYGEDVDLSYRIQKAGFKNYYVAETEIIHFKGESTKRGNLNYVRMFYGAMSTFVKKHYGGSRATVFNASIQAAIWLRAAVSAGAKFIKWIGLPVIDAIVILAAFWLIKEFWTGIVKPDFRYPDQLLLAALPAFTLVYLVTAYYAGLYDKQFKAANVWRSTVVATLVLLAGYALLPEHYRFSRGIVVFGALLAFLLISALRKVLVKAGVLQLQEPSTARPNVLVAGTQQEYEEVHSLLQKRGLQHRIIGRLYAGNDAEGAIAPLSEAGTIAAALNAQELVLCCGHLSYKKIITWMQQPALPLRLRFHAAGSCSIVGSDSSYASGEVLSSEASFNLAQPASRRAKRLIDVVFSLLFLLFFPLHFVLVKHPLGLLANAIAVLIGKKTWIGYATVEKTLPRLRPPVLASNSHQPSRMGTESEHQVDFWYAQNYEPAQDVKLILKNYHRLNSR